jgi:hypothetical protein
MRDEEQKYERVLDEAAQALRDLPVPAGPPEATLQQVLSAGEGLKITPPTKNITERLRTMQSITKIAAALLIAAGIVGIVAVFTVGNGASIAFADVVKPILTARTVVFNAIAGKPGELDTGDKTFQVKVMNKGDLPVRQEVFMPQIDSEVILILDLRALRQMTLVPKEKKAVYIDIKGLPEKPKNFLEEIRKIIKRLQEEPSFTVTELGEQKLDGRTTIGFHAMGPNIELTIWADPETALPVKLQQIQPHMEVICTDFQFDVELDDTLFSMEVPEGYSQQQTQIDVTGSTEADLIAALRLWTVKLREGVFPDEFTRVEFINKMVPILKEREEQDKAQGTEKSDEEKMAMGLTLNKGLMFVEVTLSHPDRDWHYVGQGVQFGDAASAVCWYRPEGSDTYRVIYGDLSVKDVAADALPQSP